MTWRDLRENIADEFGALDGYERLQSTLEIVVAYRLEWKRAYEHERWRRMTPAQRARQSQARRESRRRETPAQRARRLAAYRARWRSMTPARRAERLAQVARWKREARARKKPPVSCPACGSVFERGPQRSGLLLWRVQEPRALREADAREHGEVGKVGPRVPGLRQDVRRHRTKPPVLQPALQRPVATRQETAQAQHQGLLAQGRLMTASKGRPTKFDLRKAAAICKRVRQGVPLEAAALAYGISRTTLYNWRQAGAAGRQPFREFAEQIDEALAAAEVAVTLNVVRASRSDWRAGAWWLERRNPELEQKLQAGLQALLEEVRPLMSTAAYAELIQAIAQVMGIVELGAAAAPILVAETDTKH